MTRRTWLWLFAITILTVLVAYQVLVTSAGDRDREFAARADVPTVQPGVDVLSGIALVPLRIRGYDYRRAAFGEAWTDDNDAPDGHNGCGAKVDEAVQIDHFSSAASTCQCRICGGERLDGMPLTVFGDCS